MEISHQEGFLCPPAGGVLQPQLPCSLWSASNGNLKRKVSVDAGFANRFHYLSTNPSICCHVRVFIWQQIALLANTHSPKCKKLHLLFTPGQRAVLYTGKTCSFQHILKKGPVCSVSTTTSLQQLCLLSLAWDKGKHTSVPLLPLLLFFWGLPVVWQDSRTHDLTTDRSYGCCSPPIYAVFPSGLLCLLPTQSQTKVMLPQHFLHGRAIPHEYPSSRSSVRLLHAALWAAGSRGEAQGCSKNSRLHPSQEKLCSGLLHEAFPLENSDLIHQM